MKVLFYGETAECNQAIDALNSFSFSSSETNKFICVSIRDSFQKQLVEWEPSLIIVLADRSEGMEAVYLAKEIRPDTPVFWFSDDEGFGMQSHRLECDYFAVKPFTTGKLEKAFHRCEHMGIRIADIHEFRPA